MTRTVFLGTPESALPTLRLVAEHSDVVVVVTQPDRPRGRARRPQPSPVCVEAEALGLAVAKPETREQLHTAVSRAGDVDLGVVVAFGQILRPELLELPAHGFLNVHFSLLPRWRGAAPVARAIEAGDTMTGVTIIRLDEGLDTGPVLTAQAVDIGPDETAGELTGRLATLGARLLTETITPYIAGEVAPVVQLDEGATYAAKLTAADRPLDPGSPPIAIVNKIRALAPSPGATLQLEGEPHKILDGAVSESAVVPGTWAVVDGVPVLGVRGGGVELRLIQPPGKTVMDGAAWVRGRRVTRGRVH